MDVARGQRGGSRDAWATSQSNAPASRRRRTESMPPMAAPPTRSDRRRRLRIHQMEPPCWASSLIKVLKEASLPGRRGSTRARGSHPRSKRATCGRYPSFRRLPNRDAPTNNNRNAARPTPTSRSKRRGGTTPQRRRARCRPRCHRFRRSVPRPPRNPISTASIHSVPNARWREAQPSKGAPSAPASDNKPVFLEAVRLRAAIIHDPAANAHNNLHGREIPTLW